MSKSHRNVPAHPPQSSFIAPPYLPSLGAGMMSRGVWCVTWVSPWQVLREHHGPSLLSLSEKMLLGPRLWGTDLRELPLALPVGSRAGLLPRIFCEPFLLSVGTAAVGTGGWEKPHKLSHFITFHLGWKNLLVQHQLTPASVYAIDHRTLLIAQL